MATFTVDQSYTRAEIVAALGLPKLKPGGPWNTGYHRHADEIYIFCNVGIAGRTGHNYFNDFVGERLWWEGKTRSRIGQSMIDHMTKESARVHLFWRDEDRAPFRYAGLATAEEIQPTQPVRILWSFQSETGDHIGTSTEEIVASGLAETLVEGAVRTIQVNAYERNPRARAHCLAAHGYICQACGFDFEQTYGDLGHRYIHVHHVVPLSQIGSSYTIDPTTDLVPLCANCHAMVHRHNPPMPVADLRALIALRSGG
ncbi:HNH endonuclease [Frateuria aurantia]